MNIDFTPQEAQFIFENLAQLNVPMNNPQAPLITQLGHSVLSKLKTAIEVEAPPVTTPAKKKNPPGKSDSAAA